MLFGPLQRQHINMQKVKEVNNNEVYFGTCHKELDHIQTNFRGRMAQRRMAEAHEQHAGGGNRNKNMKKKQGPGGTTTVQGS